MAEAGDLTRPVNLVLGGGGMRGIGHVGALTALHGAGFRPHRVAGASAGAVVGAAAVAGARPEELHAAFEQLDYRGFALADVVGRLTGRRVLGAVVERFQPDTIEPLVWIDELLAAHGVRTWADLRIEDESLPPSRRYRLVVRCLDVVHRRVVRLPWDYPRFGLDADEQPVAEAVRASMAVPIVFDPVRIGEGDRAGLLVDGGIGTGFPVTLFDRGDGRPAGHPTFAVRLVPRVHSADWPQNDIGLLRAVVETMLEASDQLEPVDECDERRTIRVDASHVLSLDLGITADEHRTLFESGRRATEEFLATYDHGRWQQDCG